MDYGKTSIENEEEDTAILDNTTYLSKLQDRITPHEKIDNNPAPKHERRLNAALTKMGKVSNTNEPHNNTGNKPKYILSRESLKNYKTEGAIPPKLKGQLKDHKDGKPLREIADASNSPGHKLAKTSNKLFEKYTGNMKTAITGGKQLIQYIREGRFDGNFLSSCDAVALYPSVIVEEGLQLLEQMMDEDNTLHENTDLTKQEIKQLVRLCAEQPYFECEFVFFFQKEGTQMGGPLRRLLILADLIIETK